MSKKEPSLSAGRPSVSKKRNLTLASLGDNESVKRVNFEISYEQHAKLKIYAAKRRKTIREIMTEYVSGLCEE